MMAAVLEWLFVGLLAALLSNRVSASTAFGVVLLAVVATGVTVEWEAFDDDTAPPADGPTSASVRLSFRLDRNGRVVGQPVRSGVTGQNQVSTAYINLLTNSGRRAVLMCSPLRLPPELYEAWADVEVEFDSRDLR